MIYHAVSNRCAFDPAYLIAAYPDITSPGLSPALLSSMVELFFKDYGIQAVKVDMVAIAREWIGKSSYQLKAKFSGAPRVVDCSSFVKWIYAQRGIWLPRLSIQQSILGEDVSPADFLPCDLIFLGGPWYVDDPLEGVGHVGIVASDKTVIHASVTVKTVVESPLEEFLGEEFRGVRRLIPEGQTMLTLEVPKEMEIETSDDLAWLIVRDFHNWFASRADSLEIPW